MYFVEKTHICKKVANVCCSQKVGLSHCFIYHLGKLLHSYQKGAGGFDPIQLGAFRILMTTIILLLVGYKSLRGWSFEQWKWLAFTGFFGTFFPSFLFAFSETEINSSVVAVLNGLTPLFTIIIAYFSFNSR